MMLLVAWRMKVPLLGLDGIMACIWKISQCSSGYLHFYVLLRYPSIALPAKWPQAPPAKNEDVSFFSPSPNILPFRSQQWNG